MAGRTGPKLETIRLTVATRRAAAAWMPGRVAVRRATLPRKAAAVSTAMAHSSCAHVTHTMMARVLMTMVWSMPVVVMVRSTVSQEGISVGRGQPTRVTSR